MSGRTGHSETITRPLYPEWPICRSGIPVDECSSPGCRINLCDVRQRLRRVIVVVVVIVVG